MLFTDISFAVFFTAIFIIYWFIAYRNVRWQNTLLLVSSYIFYAHWDWRFLGLILITTASTFALSLYKDGKSKPALIANIIINIGILASFKYLNFFAENFVQLLNLFGFKAGWTTLNILLPVGISFYTFQAISYSIDVYRGTTSPCRNFIDYACYVAFFPQLVAGPIERSTHLLPQIIAPRQWNRAQAVDGLKYVLLGLVKKLCIADFYAVYADSYFETLSTGPSAYAALAGGIYFTIQIYCDFSAYSDIAKGVSAMLGIDLMTNFRVPYFSTNVVEYWQRWHISLTQWLRDYVYIPLGGSHNGTTRTLINIMLVFLLCGLWHGASWTYVLWGAYWGIVMVCARLLKIKKTGHAASSPSDAFGMATTVFLATVSLTIFRCESVSMIASSLSMAPILAIIAAVCATGAYFFAKHTNSVIRNATFLAIIICATAMIFATTDIWMALPKIWRNSAVIAVFALEWHYRNSDNPVAWFETRKTLRYALYLYCFAQIVFSDKSENFIYFQF